MKTIKRFEDLINNVDESLKVANINHRLFWAYRTSKDNGNNLIDFDEVIYKEDMEDIVTTLKEENIHEFTISSGFSGLVETLAEFEKHGAYMNGMTEVYGYIKDYETGERKRKPAIKMVLK